MDRSRTCTFTGHRESKLPWGYNEDDPRCRRLKRLMFDAIGAAYGVGYRHFICGMASGCDMWFGEAVLRLREERPDVTLEAAVPCEEQAALWPAALKKRYDRLVTACDTVTLVSRHYSPACMMRRNRYMVDRASLLLAVYTGAPGGTRNTLMYAMQQGVRCVELPIIEDPDEQERA